MNFLSRIEWRDFASAEGAGGSTRPLSPAPVGRSSLARMRMGEEPRVVPFVADEEDAVTPQTAACGPDRAIATAVQPASLPSRMPPQERPTGANGTAAEVFDLPAGATLRRAPGVPVVAAVALEPAPAVSQDLESLPLPPVPPDADLRRFRFMPLDVARLRDSELAASLSAEGFRAAVLLWCAAWHQVPAGSLPNNDAALAVLALYGRNATAFQQIKSEALRGFVIHSDGRLYHAVIVEKAIEALGRSRAGAKAANERHERERLGGKRKTAVALQETGTGTGKRTRTAHKLQRSSPAQPPVCDTGEADWSDDEKAKGKAIIEGFDKARLAAFGDEARRCRRHKADDMEIAIGWLRAGATPGMVVETLNLVLKKMAVAGKYKPTWGLRMHESDIASVLQEARKLPVAASAPAAREDMNRRIDRAVAQARSAQGE